MIRKLLVWPILLAIGFAGASAVDCGVRRFWRISGEQVGLTIVRSVPKAPEPNPRPAIAGSPCSPQFVLRCSTNPVKPYAQRRDLEFELAAHCKKMVSRAFIPQDLGVGKDEKHRAFFRTGNQQDERALLRFARPQDLVSKPVKYSFQVEGYIILVTGPSLLPAAEIVDLAADGHDSLTGAVIERTADSRSLWEFEVVARPRHPLFGFPLLVTAFSDFVPVERHGDFVAQQQGPRNPPAALSDPRYRTPAGRPDPKELV